jgi:hypothetical protein
MTENPDSLVPFVDARPGDRAAVYCGEYIREHTDYGWVADLEYFDERYGEVKLTRQVWQLVSEDEFTLPDPHPADEDDADAARRR